MFCILSSDLFFLPLLGIKENLVLYSHCKEQSSMNVSEFNLNNEFKELNEEEWIQSSNNFEQWIQSEQSAMNISVWKISLEQRSN